MLGRVFGYSSQMRLHDMIAVQERHFTIRLYPDLEAEIDSKKKEIHVNADKYLILGVLCKVI
jgi:hypothetical protein